MLSYTISETSSLPLPCKPFTNRTHHKRWACI